MTEEPKFPDRDLVVPRLTSVEKNAGSFCAYFLNSFHESVSFFDRSTLGQERRSMLTSKIKELSPSYVFPRCVVIAGDELKTEEKKKAEDKEKQTEKVIKFEWREESAIMDDREAGEDKENDDSETEKQEEPEDSGDYGEQYDREDGDDDGDDDSDDGDVD